MNFFQKIVYKTKTQLYKKQNKDVKSPKKLDKSIDMNGYLLKKFTKLPTTQFLKNGKKTTFKNHLKVAIKYKFTKGHMMDHKKEKGLKSGDTVYTNTEKKLHAVA